MVILRTLYQFHIIGGKQSYAPVRAFSPPPTIVNLLYLSDEVTRVKGYLGFISCMNKMKSGRLSDKVNIGDTQDMTLNLY